jgi:hypothetical protein
MNGSLGAPGGVSDMGITRRFGQQNTHVSKIDAWRSWGANSGAQGFLLI